MTQYGMRIIDILLRKFDKHNFDEVNLVRSKAQYLAVMRLRSAINKRYAACSPATGYCRREVSCIRLTVTVRLTYRFGCLLLRSPVPPLF